MRDGGAAALSDEAVARLADKLARQSTESLETILLSHLSNMTHVQRGALMMGLPPDKLAAYASDCYKKGLDDAVSAAKELLAVIEEETKKTDKLEVQ